MNSTENVGNFTDSMLYAQFKDVVGPSFVLASTAIVLNLISIPGIFMNAAIIYVTIKYSTIRGTSSFLLALTAFYDILHGFAHFLFLFVALFGHNFIRYGLAFKFLAIPLLGVGSSVFTMALTGLDRLLQIATPKWHANINRHLYSGILVSASLLAGILPIFKYGQTAMLIADQPTTGYISDIFVLDFGGQFFLFMLACNCLAIAFYLAVWVVLQKKNAEVQQHSAINKESKTNSRVFKSLVAIIGINIGGYFLCVFVRLFFLPLFHFSPIQHWLIESYLGILLNLGVALNAIVLFFCCAEYRRCFLRELGLFSHKFFAGRYPSQVATTSAIAPISTIQGNTTQIPSANTSRANK